MSRFFFPIVVAWEVLCVNQGARVPRSKVSLYQDVLVPECKCPYISELRCREGVEKVSLCQGLSVCTF